MMYRNESTRMLAIRLLMDRVQRVADAACDVLEALESGDESLARELRDEFNAIGERVSDEPFRRLADAYREAAIDHAAEVFRSIVRAAEGQAPMIIDAEYTIKM